MDTNLPKEPHVISAERLNGGVIITFEDGRSAIYSSSLLDSIFAQAEDVSNLPGDDFPVTRQALP
jgi:hypothetical protein